MKYRKIYDTCELSIYQNDVVIHYCAYEYVYRMLLLDAMQDDEVFLHLLMSSVQFKTTAIC